MNWTCHTQSFPCDKSRACQKAELFVGVSIVAPIMALQFLEHTKCRALRPLTMQARITTVTCRATAPMRAAQAPRHRMQPCRAGNSNILRCFPLLSRTLLTCRKVCIAADQSSSKSPSAGHHSSNGAPQSAASDSDLVFVLKLVALSFAGELPWLQGSLLSL